jgi:hypothetical protein
MPKVKNQINIPPYLQIILHILCAIFYSANGQGLIQDEHTAKWIITIIGSTQSVLAIYGIFTPSPNAPVQPPPPGGAKR